MGQCAGPGMRGHKAKKSPALCWTGERCFLLHGDVPDAGVAIHKGENLLELNFPAELDGEAVIDGAIVIVGNVAADDRNIHPLELRQEGIPQLRGIIHGDIDIPSGQGVIADIELVHDGLHQNNDDGSVTAQFQGKPNDINKVILSLQNIDRIQIDFISEKDIPLDYYENHFYILY